MNRTSENWTNFIIIEETYTVDARKAKYKMWEAICRNLHWALGLWTQGMYCIEKKDHIEIQENRLLKKCLKPFYSYLWIQ